MIGVNQRIGVIHSANEVQRVNHPSLVLYHCIAANAAVNLIPCDIGCMRFPPVDNYVVGITYRFYTTRRIGRSYILHDPVDRRAVSAFVSTVIDGDDSIVIHLVLVRRTQSGRVVEIGHLHCRATGRLRDSRHKHAVRVLR